MNGSPPEDLIRAIRTVEEGKAFVDPSLSPALLMTQGVVDAPLSEREREILQLLAEGFHTEEVADRIGLSPETVKSDTKRAIVKLEADGRVHAVAIAQLERQAGKQPDDTGHDQDRAYGAEVDSFDRVADRVSQNGPEGRDEYGCADGHTAGVPRIWIFMQVVLLICLLASLVIAVIKL